MNENPYQLHNSPIAEHLATSGEGQRLLEVSLGENEAWEKGHGSRDAEVAALKEQIAALKDEKEQAILGMLNAGEEVKALKAELASVRDELRVGNRLYAELTDKCRQVENERDAAIREVGAANRALGSLQQQHDALRLLAHTLVHATRWSLQGEAPVSVAEGVADEVETWLEEHK